MPHVSIIVPTYNCADYLKETLDTVLGQTYEDWEVIVVNNFSTDHTKEVIAGYQDPRIHSLDFDNGGVIAAARNHGATQAKGKFLAFLDSDDLWHCEKLARSLEAMGDDYGFSSHNMSYFGDSPRLRNQMEEFESLGTDYQKLLFGRNGIITSTVMVLREDFEKAGGFSEDPQIITAEDFDLWIRLLHQGTAHVYLKDVLGQYRLHATSSSMGNVQRHADAKYHVLNSLYEAFENSQGQQKAYRRQAALFDYQSGRNYQTMGEFSKARHCFFESWKKNPFRFNLYLACGLLGLQGAKKLFKSKD